MAVSGLIVTAVGDWEVGELVMGPLLGPVVTGPLLGLAVTGLFDGEEVGLDVAEDKLTNNAPTITP